VPIVERLLKSTHLEKVAQLKECKQKQEEEILKKECTFHPQINETRSDKSRLRDSPMGFPKANASMRQDPESHSCTFRPVVNEAKVASNAMKTYLEQNAFERLSAPKNYSIEMMNRLSTENKEKSTNKVNEVRRLSTTNIQDKNEFYHEEDFLQRQEMYENYKVEKITNVIEDISKTYETKKFVNPKSEELLERAAKKEPKPVIKENSIAGEEYTFHPKISMLGEKARPKTFEEMSYEPMLQKEQKISSLRGQIERNINESLTFKPLLNSKYANINSKIGYQDPDYINRIKYSNQEKEMKNNMIRETLQSKDLEECTHKPQITRYEPKKTVNKVVGRTKKENKYSQIHNTMRY
jgi:hypothetical protein